MIHLFSISVLLKLTLNLSKAQHFFLKTFSQQVITKRADPQKKVSWFNEKTFSSFDDLWWLARVISIHKPLSPIPVDFTRMRSALRRIFEWDPQAIVKPSRRYCMLFLHYCKSYEEEKPESKHSIETVIKKLTKTLSLLRSILVMACKMEKERKISKKSAHEERCKKSRATKRKKNELQTIKNHYRWLQQERKKKCWNPKENEGKRSEIC